VVHAARRTRFESPDISVSSSAPAFSAGNRPLLQRQKTTLAQSHEKVELSSLDDAVSLRSFKTKDGEERSVVGEGDVNLYVVEDKSQEFDFSDDDDGVIRVIAVLDLHPSFVCRNFYSTFQHH